MRMIRSTPSASASSHVSLTSLPATIHHSEGGRVSESHVTLPHAAGQHGLVAHQFDDLDQQHKADSLGMWVFLATEVLFFGVLFTAYAIYRMLYPAAWAEASHHLNQPLGTLNTAVLLCSSLSVVLAVHAAQTGHRKRLVALLLLTVVLGTVFLG